MARFLQKVVVEDKVGSLFLHELDIKLRLEFPDALKNLQDPKSVAAFLGNVVKDAFPGSEPGRMRKGPSVARRVFYKRLRFVSATEEICSI